MAGNACENGERGHGEYSKLGNLRLTVTWEAINNMYISSILDTTCACSRLITEFYNRAILGLTCKRSL